MVTGRSKQSGDTSSDSFMSRKDEMRQTLSTTYAEQDGDDEGEEEDDNNNAGKSSKPKKSTKDFWDWADICWHRYRFKDLVLVFLLVAYLVVAAMVMVILEERTQTENRIGYDKAIEELWYAFAGNLTRQLLNTSDLVLFVDSDISSKFEKKVRDQLEQYHAGLLEIYESKDGRYLEWDFWNATLFGLSLFTTIGYKHLYPITTEGKIATMLFATFGIPLLLTIIQHLALFFYDTLTFILNSIISFCKRKWTAVMIKKHGHGHTAIATSPKRRSGPRVALPFSIGVFLLLTWIFACPLTILLWEPDWTYLDAFYYFFLSFTTVGLDYGAPIRHHYLYIVWLWAVIGLALLSLCFKILYAPGRMARKQSLEQFEHIGYKSASMAAQTDSACVPSDWCVSTISLASKSIGPSQLVKVGTPKLPRKILHTHMKIPSDHEEEPHEKPRHKRRHFGNHRYDLICDQSSANFLAKAEDANFSFKSKDALSGMSEDYKEELKWLSKVGQFSETQSLNDMTMTDAVDEKKFMMEAMKQRDNENRSVHLAWSAGDTTSTATSTSVGISPVSQ